MSGELALSGIVEPAAGALLAQVARASVAGGVLAAAVWALARLAPRLPSAWRCALWWAVSLKLVLALVWVAPLELPLLPAAGPETGTALAATPAAVLQGGSPVGAAPATAEVGRGAAAAGPPVQGGVSPSPAAGPLRELPWRPALALLWLLGVAAGAAGLGRELAATRRLVRDSRPAADPALLALFDRLREHLGVRGRVALRLSETVPSPLTVGLLRPAVVLPAQAPEELPPEELELALGHELLHVRRRDLWTGWLPVFAARLFFFHPLAALALREYRLAREGACDAAVVRELGAAPRAYGRLLLRWTHAPAPGTALAAGAASPSFLDLKRRLVMLQNPSPLSRSLRLLAWSAALLAVVALVPVRIVAAHPPPAPPAPPAAPTPPDHVAALRGAPPEPPEPPEPPVRIAARAPEAPVAPKAPEAPEPPRAPEPPDRTVTTHSWGWTGDGDAWALVDGSSHVWMSGSYREMERARRIHSETGEPVLWIGRDGREYVIRDRATIERVREILEPQQELGRQQGELGGQQGELGARQGELGAQQGELGAHQGELGSQQARLGAEQASIAGERAALESRRRSDELSGDEYRRRRDELEARQEELSRRMRDLGAQQGELGERQGELGARQAELGKQQAALGARQAELGERQREAAETARPLLRELFDRAIESGLAEPVGSGR
jgi:beta-lactamase regulating signal transducer with metallopeptidase domain